MKNLKRTLCMILALAMVISLAACGEAAKPAADAPDEQNTQRLSTDPVGPESEPVPAPSVAAIAADYLSGTAALTEFYHPYSGDATEGWIWTEIGIENRHHDFCPSATYPSSEWTPEEVLKSYIDGTAPWVEVPDSVLIGTGHTYTSNAKAALWSNDFTNQFVITNDGWLEIDSVRALPHDCPTGDIDPLSLLKAYQSGEWGGSALWSSDYSICVEGTHGSLRYVSRNPAACSDSKYAFNCNSSHPFWEGLNEVQGFEVQSKANDVGSIAVVFCYLDFPNGTTDDLPGKFLFSVGQEERGSWAVTTSGAFLYLKGTLDDSWSLKMDPDKGFLVARSIWANPNTPDYAYDGSRLVELLPGGEIDVLFDGVSADLDHAYGVFWLYFVEDGNLKRWRNFQSEIDVMTIIEGDVVRTVGTAPVFFEKTDGNVYAFDPSYRDKNDDLIISCLGSEAMEDYVAAWDEFVASLAGGEYDVDDFAAFCEKIGADS